MAKKKKEPRLEAWCWYCDREFEDDKVLLNHQKAKHYRCPYCPRRLNTAGGLTVHLHQVHKAEPTKIENALPGRESFDIEIYGMVGIPEADLEEWRSRRGNQQGPGSNGGPAPKRQKIENVALTPEQLKAQLEAHKALMSGKAPPPGAVAGQFHSPNPGIPPPMMGYPPTGPPPGFGVPPPPLYNRPPPPMLNRPPPGMPPPSLAGPYSGPPPSFYPSGPPPRPSPMVIPHITLPSTNPHQEAVKSGAKSRMVYSDVTMSPEEKLASTSKYLYVDPEDAKQRQTALQYPPPPNPSAGPSMPQQYYGPPPGFGAGSPPGTMSSPYAASPHSPFVAQQQQQQHYGSYAGYSSPQPQGPPPNINYSSNPSQSHAQSYPSISSGGRGGIEQASHHPEENTAEALNRANNDVGSGIQREIDMAGMESISKVEQSAAGLSPEPIGITEASSPQPNASQTSRPGRARAADLF